VPARVRSMLTWCNRCKVSRSTSVGQQQSLHFRNSMKKSRHGVETPGANAIVSLRHQSIRHWMQSPPYKKAPIQQAAGKLANRITKPRGLHFKQPVLQTCVAGHCSSAAKAV
jgi:hypothetical protein